MRYDTIVDGPLSNVFFEFLLVDPVLAKDHVWKLLRECSIFIITFRFGKLFIFYFFVYLNYWEIYLEVSI